LVEGGKPGFLRIEINPENIFPRMLLYEGQNAEGCLQECRLSLWATSGGGKK
jgi:hypothetical protein